VLDRPTAVRHRERERPVEVGEAGGGHADTLTGASGRLPDRPSNSADAPVPGVSALGVGIRV
jgi:hypothetical protein